MKKFRYNDVSFVSIYTSSKVTVKRQLKFKCRTIIQETLHVNFCYYSSVCANFQGLPGVDSRDGRRRPKLTSRGWNVIDFL